MCEVGVTHHRETNNSKRLSTCQVITGRQLASNNTNQAASCKFTTRPSLPSGINRKNSYYRWWYIRCSTKPELWKEKSCSCFPWLLSTLQIFRIHDVATQGSHFVLQTLCWWKANLKLCFHCFLYQRLPRSWEKKERNSSKSPCASLQVASSRVKCK